MGDTFAPIGSIIDDDPVAARGKIEFAGHVPGDQQEVSHQVLLIVPGLIETGYRFPWNNQDMDGGLGINIPDHESQVVLMDNLGRYVTGKDSFEEGGFTHR